MEKGMIQYLMGILDNFQLDIVVTTADRHSNVKREMKTHLKFTHIKHQFDLWHIAKGLSKKIVKFTKNKGLKVN